MIEDVPPRLYHRTVKDAAFQILDGSSRLGLGTVAKFTTIFRPCHWRK